MTYAEPYVYVRALGSFGTAAATNLEQWGIGLKFRNPGAPPSVANLTAFLETISVPFTNFHTSAGVGSGSACWLKELTAAYVGTDGKYVGGASQQTTRRLYGTPSQGQGGIGAPFTQALVYSLRTALSRGPGSNGRMYYPALGLSVGTTTGVLAPATANGAVAAAGTLFNNLNAAADAMLPGTGGLSVMSNVLTGVAATVTAVRVGNKIDRQESREAALVEAYVSAPITPVALFAFAPDNTRAIGT